MLVKIKEFFKKHFNELILAIFIILISLFSFAAGFIVAKFQEKKPLRIEFEFRDNLLRKGVGETHGFPEKEKIKNRGFLKSEPEARLSRAPVVRLERVSDLV
ncbi:hypothetical protein AMJ49_03205 [Parcubacteria bacterium DG_74_2]|nr:MAG: hypothetical protein AMJ49_03205 [Parcubacteria bacterium DG_74_2]